ncbi:MAG TPA: hypothetical protein VFN73_07980 [Propionibacteriaceae bacterium]|nr:hypothetical protein [Propionibacteriaceae bacterium]
MPDLSGTFADPIAGYHDWPAFLDGAGLAPGPEVLPGAAALLGVPRPLPVGEVRRERPVVAGRVAHTRLSWSVGFGPDMAAWLCHPVDADPARLPGVLYLPSHGGLKEVGAERLLDLPDLPGWLLAYRSAEGGRGAASALAARGVTVVVPDSFTWGARRFDLRPPDGVRPDHATFEALAAAHEDILAKYCLDLGTTYAGMVAHDDLSALQVLRRLAAPGEIGVIGFSGGGGRAAALGALAPAVGTVVIAGMMSTLRSLVPAHTGRHSWLLHVPGLASGHDLPGLAAAARRHRLMVVYGEADPLFPLAGMRAADAALVEAFRGASGEYRGVWHPGGHEFGVAQQEDAFDFLLGRSDAGPPTSTG